MAAVDETQGVGRFSREPGHVHIEEAVQDDTYPDFLSGLPLDAGFRSLAVVHEAAGDVPVALRESADRLHHEDSRPVREDDLGDAADHRRVDRPLDERIDIGPFEHGIPTDPFLRVMVEAWRALLDAILAEVHEAVRIRREGQGLAGSREPESPAVPHQVNLAVRLDENVFAIGFLAHPPNDAPSPY